MTGFERPRQVATSELQSGRRGLPDIAEPDRVLVSPEHAELCHPARLKSSRIAGQGVDGALICCDLFWLADHRGRRHTCKCECDLYSGTTQGGSVHCLVKPPVGVRAGLSVGDTLLRPELIVHP